MYYISVSRVRITYRRIAYRGVSHIDVTYQPPGAVDREFLVYFSIFFGPGPLKNASEKIALRSFCPDFRAEISHGEPNLARDNFQQK